MIYYMTPKVLPKGHIRYGMFEVDNDGRLIRIDWSNDLNNLFNYKTDFGISVGMWNKTYHIDNFIANISEDCIVFTKESHPEYFI